ncbi:MAG TPA: hypothetical protein VF273_00795 [Pelobium sp.]
MEKITCVLYNPFDIERQNLVLLLASIDFIELIGQSSNLEDCIDLNNNLEPQLLFIAVKPNQNHAFKVLEKLKKQPTIIFIIDDETAIEAPANGSFYYLNTPVKLPDVQNVLKNFTKTHRQLADKMQGLLNKLKFND